MLQKYTQYLHYTKIKTYYTKYERLLMPATLVFGFIVDAVTFRTIDMWSSFALLGVHIILAGCAIAYINMYDAGKIRGLGRTVIVVRYGRLAAPFLLQLSFGALLSAAFIFYLFGSAVSASWPLLLVVLFLAFSNEIYKEYYLRVSVQMVVYFFTLFTVLALLLPFIFGSISGWLFVLAGMLSLLFTTGFMYMLGRAAMAIWEQRLMILQNMAGVLLIMFVLYFLNIIPPLPLTLRDSGVYHSVVRQDDVYVLEADVQTWWQKIVPGEVIHIIPGQQVYVFSSIYAPRNIGTTIIHEWQLYDEQHNEWITMDRLWFYVQGGRQEGYRGYTYKTAVPEGKWRVDVQTTDGRVFGRVKFDVVGVDEPVPHIQIYN